MIEAVKSFLRAEGFFVVLILFIVLASFSPILFGGKAFFDEEQIGFYYPHSFFYSQAVGADSSLLWNNGYYGGVSVPFDQHVSAYFPLNRLLFSALDYLSARHVSIFIGVLLGCLFAYFFGRLFKFSKSASFILASSYLLSTTLAWLDIGTLAAWSFFMIPALFFAIAKVGRKEQPILWTILGGVFIGVGFLAGFSQITFYGYVIAGVFALYLSFTSPAENPLRVRILLAFGGMTILGVLLSLPQTLPSLFLASDSVRTSSHALQNVFPLKLTNLAAFILPEYIYIPFVGGGTHGFYVGALPFLAMLVGFLLFRTKVQIFFAFLYVGFLLVSFHIPPLSWLNDYLPPFSRFGSSSRWMVAASFPLAFLAASGYENLFRLEVFSKKEGHVFRIIGWGLAILFFILVAANVGLAVFEKIPNLQNDFLDWYFRGKTLSFPHEHYFNVLSSAVRDARSALSLFNWRVIVPFLLLGASFFLIRRFREGKFTKERFEKIAVALVVLNVLLIPLAMLDRAFFPASVFSVKPRMLQAIESLKNDPESFRIAGFLIGESTFWEITSKRKLSVPEHAELLREALVLNTNVIYGIDRLDGAGYYRTLRHNQILDTVIFPRGLDVFDREALKSVKGPLHRVYNTEVLKTVTLVEKINHFLASLPLLSAFNVKYIYSLVPLSHDDLREIPFPSTGIEGLSIHLYENKNVLPRIYFAKNPKFFSGDENELLGLMVDNRDFRETTFIECVDCEEQTSGVKRKFDVLRYENGLLEIEVDAGKSGPSPTEAASAREGGWLVFSESFSPGWEARIDGTSVSIYRANYIMQGIFVSPGPHDIEFRHIGVVSKKWQEFRQLFPDYNIKIN